MSASTTRYFDDTKIYQFGIINDGAISVIGSGTSDSNAVRFFSTNQTDDFQQWTVVYVNSTPEYPYRWKVKRSGFYLSSKCDFELGDDCTKGTVNRANLVPSQKPEDVPETGWWNAIPSDENDGSYRWYSRANGTNAWLDAVGSVISMNSNITAGSGGRWTLSEVGTIDSSTTNSTSTNGTAGSRSAGLSGGAIGGIVVGVIAALLLLTGAFGLLYRRRRARQTKTKIEKSQSLVQEVDSTLKPELEAHSISPYSNPMKSGYSLVHNVELSSETDRTNVHGNSRSDAYAELPAP